MKCPYCGSDDCKKVSLAYEAGTSKGTFGGVGLAAGGGSSGSVVGGTGFGGNTFNQTLLAKRLSPPTEPQPVSAIICGLIAISSLISAFSILYDPKSDSRIEGCVVCLIIAAIMGFLVRNQWMKHVEKRKEYARILALWQDSWVCLRCGRDWQPDTDSEKSVRGTDSVILRRSRRI